MNSKTLVLSYPRRLFSSLIDLIVCSIIAGTTLGATTKFVKDPGYLGPIFVAILIGFLVILPFYRWICHAAISGQTIGKYLFRIKVLSSDDTTLNWKGSTYRSMYELFFGISLPLAFIASQYLCSLKNYPGRILIDYDDDCVRYDYYVTLFFAFCCLWWMKKVIWTLGLPGNFSKIVSTKEILRKTKLTNTSLMQ